MRLIAARSVYRIAEEKAYSTCLERNSMISKKIVDAFNGQLNAELYSAYLYLSMGAYLASVKLPGYAAWMRSQVQEETEHTMKFFDHLIFRGGRVLLEEVKRPSTQWDSPLALAEATCQHERKVTGLIKDLMVLAKTESDQDSQDLLQWFIDEQEEEEESVGKVLDKIKTAGSDPRALAQADVKLGKRGQSSEIADT